MKPISTILALLAFFLGAAPSHARDLHLVDGRVLHDVVVTSKDSHELRIIHSNGSMAVPVASLSVADFMELNVPKEAGYSSNNPHVPAVPASAGSPSYSPSGATASAPTSPGGSVHVRAYVRKDGTFVREHTRKR